LTDCDAKSIIGYYYSTKRLCVYYF